MSPLHSTVSGNEQNCIKNLLICCGNLNDLQNQFTGHSRTNTNGISHDDFERSSTWNRCVDAYNQVREMLEERLLNFKGIPLEHGSGFATPKPHYNPQPYKTCKSSKSADSTYQCSIASRGETRGFFVDADSDPFLPRLVVVLVDSCSPFPFSSSDSCKK